METNFTTSVTLEQAKRLVELGYPRRLRDDGAAYALVDYTHNLWIDGEIKIKAGDFVTVDEFYCEPEENFVPAPSYAEAIDWLIEHGFMDLEWDFVKRVEEVLK